MCTGHKPLHPRHFQFSWALFTADRSILCSSKPTLPPLASRPLAQNNWVWDTWHLSLALGLHPVRGSVPFGRTLRPPPFGPARAGGVAGAEHLLGGPVPLPLLPHHLLRLGGLTLGPLGPFPIPLLVPHAWFLRGYFHRGVAACQTGNQGERKRGWGRRERERRQEDDRSERMGLTKIFSVLKTQVASLRFRAYSLGNCICNFGMSIPK